MINPFEIMRINSISINEQNIEIFRKLQYGILAHRDTQIEH